MDLERLAGQRTHSGRHLSVALLVVGLLLALVPSVPASAADGRPVVTPAATAARGYPVGDFPQRPTGPGCFQPNQVDICRITRYQNRPWLLLWGDSHALMYLTPFKVLAKKYKINLVSMFSGGCPLSVPFPAGSSEPRLTCDKQNVGTLKYVQDLVRSGRKVKVVVGGYWASYRALYDTYAADKRAGRPTSLTEYQQHVARLAVERTPAMFRALNRLGASVDVLAQAPLVPADARRCPAGRTPYACDLPRSRSLPDEAKNRRFLAARIKLLKKPVRLLDPAPYVCTKKVCRARVNGVPTWYDAAHLGSEFTRQLKPLFRPVVLDLVRGRQPR